MRLLTYNILEGGLSCGGRLGSVVDLIRDAAPDVLSLNECNGFQDEGDRTLYRLEDALGMRGVLAEARTGFHVAIFVRGFQLMEAHRMNDWFHHAALRVKACRGDRELTLMTAHLSPFSSEARVREAQYLASYVRDEHVILLGDLNAISPHDAARAPLGRMSPHRRSRQLMPGTDRIDTRAVAVLESAGLVDLWQQAHPTELGCTLATPLVDKAPRPQVRFDYIFGTPPIAEKLRSIRVLENDTTRGASDHFPLLAEIDF